ncbi:MAG: lysophospholipid acyltransferase family protein [Candidatus Omnitrophica bacterium]|nr:lysophospholipid acyltransferase family protein [Candidatus Omnitrophota bacterium]
MTKAFQVTVRRFIAAAIYSSFWTIWLLPSILYRPLSLIIGSLGYYTMRLSRCRVITNLAIAFGSTKSAAWQRRTCRRLFCEIVHNAIEMIALGKTTGQNITEKVVVNGEEILSEALKVNRGVVAVCAHLGNFPAMQIKLLNLGFPMNVIIRNATNTYLNNLWDKMMKKAGMRYIFKANLARAIEESRKSLARGECLCIYLDQHAGNGVKVPFFGHGVMVPVGASVLARKYRTPVVGIFTFRRPEGNHQVVIEGPYQLQRTDDPESDVKVNTALFISRVEKYVREHPEQWFSWLHRRFR